MTGSGLQEPAVEPIAGEGAHSRGRFFERILSFDRDRIKHKLIPWAMKGGLALLDQGVFAGTNFVISILLARWLSAEQYGTYAVAFAVFLFLLNFHQALLLEPMLVFGSSVYRNSLRGYMKSLLLLHLGMSVVMAFGLCVSAVVAFKLGQANGLPGALLGIAFAAPTLFLFWLTKRTFYLKLSPAPSAAAAILYCALTLGGLALVYRQTHQLTPLSAFLLGIGRLGASVVPTGVSGVAAHLEPGCSRRAGRLETALALWTVGAGRERHDVDSDQCLLSDLEQVRRTGASGRTEGLDELCRAHVASVRGTPHTHDSVLAHVFCRREAAPASPSCCGE